MLLKKFSNYMLEAGTDEAGRGCIAGPVTAAAIILSDKFDHIELNDSKKLSKKTREDFRIYIEHHALSFAVTHIYPEEIDEINILNASMKGMQESVLKLSSIPQFIIVDGNRALNAKLGILTNGKQFTKTEIDILQSIPNQSIIQGDGKYMSIAAASILAKTHRDKYMNIIHEEFPMYNWKKNKGYPTKEHRAAILKYGVSKYHRLSFRLLAQNKLIDE